MSFLSENIGIDLGTSSVKIFIKGSGVILKEPSLAAVDKQGGKILAVGQEADEIVGKIPDSVFVVRPIDKGEITDFNTAKGLFKMFIDKCTGGSILKPRVIVAASSDCTDVQKRVIEEALVAAGAKSVTFKDKSLAAAVGAGVDINDISGNMVIDIGGGTAVIAVISMGAVVASKTVRTAGNDFSCSIIRYIKNKYGVSIGHSMAEEVKFLIDREHDPDSEEYMVIGRDVSTGLPRGANIILSELKKALFENMSSIVDGIKSVIEVTPPELVSDIMKKGAVLTGGSSVLACISEMIDKELYIPIVMADNPDCSVISGLGSFIQKEYTF